MNAARLGVVCDLREECWYSMDLVADMLLAQIPAVSGGSIAATRLCPTPARTWTRMPLVGRTPSAALADRLVGRLWTYPRWLAPLAADFDLFHVVDHSYAHLVRVLPASRTVVSCHDLDAVRGALPGSRERYRLSTLLAGAILDGLALAHRQRHGADGAGHVRMAHLHSPSMARPAREEERTPRHRALLDAVRHHDRFRSPEGPGPQT